GQAVTFTATISVVPPSQGTPTGTVTFLDGSTTLGSGPVGSNGRATFSATALTLGAHTITAVYSGDAVFAGSTSTPFSQVVQAVTTTALTSSANPSVTNQTITFTATVTPSQGAATPTGMVTFKDGTTALGTGVLNGNGQATLTVSTLAVGTHTITASYGGDSNSAGSTSSPLIQTVAVAPTITALAASANPSTTTVPVTFTATVTVAPPGAGLPTGTVVFKDGSVTLGMGTLNSSGQASFTTDRLLVGPHTITATYGGDANFAASTSAALTQNVAQIATQTALSASSNPAAAGQPVTLSATVTVVPPGTGTPTGTVNFILQGGGTLGAAMLNASGQAVFVTAALPMGTQAIVAAYVGDASFAASVSTTLPLVVSGNGIVGGTQTQRFVAHLYQDLLQRPPDTIGFAYYTSQLDQGAFSRAQVAAAFLNSQEYRTLQVQNIYHTLLGRDVDTSGLKTALQFLVNGGTIEQLKAIISGSAEYLQVRGGGTLGGFLNALFQDAFNRPIDTSGQATYTQALGHGMSRIQVAQAIYSSAEYQQDLVESFYMRYLHRVADSVGLTLSVASLSLGRTDEFIIQAIVSSAEYLSLV
ncbi:MAG TPA: Ig-like domain repeat protein, partial [Gemmataceae bacterium]|nr:Ig-like domain repeat protein [Gemmataceae bacterium]